jgi:hypothetical protein
MERVVAAIRRDESLSQSCLKLVETGSFRSPQDFVVLSSDFNRAAGLPLDK